MDGSDSNSRFIEVPKTYVNAPDSHIRITNHPESAPGVTSILIARLNRPSKLNAITTEMIADLITLWERVDVDDRVKVVILTGEGKAFSAGIDLNMDASNAKNLSAPSQMRDPGGTLALAMFNCRKPIIVAYNGLSVGIGMTSTLAATIRSVNQRFPNKEANARSTDFDIALHLASLNSVSPFLALA